MMEIKNKTDRIKSLHQHRFYKFRTIDGALPKKYFEFKRRSVIILGVTIMIFLLLFFFTNYKETSLKIGIFAVFFTLYKIYKVFTEPYIVVNTKGLTLRTAHFRWTKIKKITPDYDFKTETLHFQILLKENTIAYEKVEHFPFSDYLALLLIIRTFKKKTRIPYIFINKGSEIRSPEQIKISKVLFH